MGLGAYFCVYDVVVKKFTFAILSPDEFLFFIGWLVKPKISRPSLKGSPRNLHRSLVWVKS